MATSSKFDPSTSSDRPPYPSGPRGLYGGPSLDRPGSFRESMDIPILSSLPSMSRSSLRVTQGDVRNFFECLHFDPESVGSDNKVQVLGEIKRIANVVLGTLHDGSASGSLKGRLLSSLSHEDLKKTKAALQEGSDEARERGRMYGEALSMFRKFFPSIPLRKKSRADTVSSDRVNVLPVNNRPGLGPRIMKMGAPDHAVINAPREQKKSDERTKNTKRTRTSLLDTRVNSLAKHCTLMDKDRNVGKGANSGIVLDNDLISPIESWERSKMKKKRSVIKTDVSPSKSSAKPVDSHRELKQGMRQRLATDLAFRSGVGNGTVGIGKLDSGVQQTDSGVRPPNARVDLENGALFGKERPSDKDRVNLRNINKSGRREDYSSPSPNSSAKLIPSPRPPQFNKGILPKMPPSSQQQPTACSDWEISQCTNKPSVASGPTNKKRTSSVRSSSPPVAHWAGQRPQKIMRAARRTNFLPIVSNNDETPSVDSMSDVGNDNGFMFAKDFPSISAQQGNLKIEQFSESEESGVAETKKETKKVKKIYAKGDGRAGHNVKKASIPVLPAHKKKLLGKELGDGLRRQGRTSRSLTSSRSLMPTTMDKLATIGAAKQPRPSRMGLDKAESKVGRPPMRKLSGRTAYANNRLSTMHAAADFGDDGQQELLAAAKAVVDDPSHLILFWRHMELMFRLISETDIGFLKQQAEVMSILDTQKIPASVDANSALNCLNGPCVENLGYSDLIHAPEELISAAAAHTPVPLCQRLIAALITDEEDDGNASIEEMQLNPCEPRFQLDAALESGALMHESVGNVYSAASTDFNGCNATATSRSLHDLEALGKPEHQSHMVSIQNLGGVSSSGYLADGLRPGSEMISMTESQAFYYKNMSLNERLLLEIQSLGVFSEQPEIREMDNEEISQEIIHLNEEYHQKVAKKRCFILNLLKSASQSKELQENNFEQCALKKLVTMAYAKYTASFGVRGANSKIVKQTALAFVNRALEHCHSYEASGICCFSEPLFKIIFNEALNKIAEVQSVDFITENESGKDYPNTPFGSQQIGHHVQTGDLYSPNVQLQEPSSSEQNNSRQDVWSNKTKKRKLLDAGNGSPGTAGPPMSNTKGKRSDRDRDGKGRAGNTISKSAKLVRPVVGNTNGDRKSKAKAKQKTHVSTSVNGLLGKAPEQSSLPSENMENNNSMAKQGFGVDGINDPVVDLSGLEIPGIDVDLDGQGQDLASWLNIDDDSLQDHDFMGLEIPMDDLSDVNMMV